MSQKFAHLQPPRSAEGHVPHVSRTRGPRALTNRILSFRTWARAKKPPVEPELDDDIPLEVIAEARIGSVLCGKYRLDQLLGVGGTAAVYRATHRNSRRFAIKLLHPQLSFNTQVRVRFQREGWLANSVAHRGVVAALDDDIAEDGSAFLVMELLDGKSVESLWNRCGALPVPIALAIGDQLLDVLIAAHARSIVHRDLKPGNLFLTQEGVLKVLDFGIARLGPSAAGATTKTGIPLGTPGFMAPEQAVGRWTELGPEADIWATGATLFALISGQYVQEGETPFELLVQSTIPARSLASAAPNVPEALVRAIDRALAYDKRERYPDAASMRAALQQAYSEAFGCALDAAPRVLCDWFEQQEREVAGAQTLISGTQPTTKGRWLTGVAVTLLLASLAGAGLWYCWQPSVWEDVVKLLAV